MKDIISQTLNISLWSKSQKFNQYTIKECQNEGSIIELYDAKQSKNNESVTIWQWKNNMNLKDRSIIQNAILTLKKIRHPNILSYIDDEINDHEIVMISEHVITLESYLRKMRLFKEDIQEDLISWGILSIFKLIHFLHNSCGLQNSNISISTIFVNDRHEWKLGGFEFINHLSHSCFPFADDFFEKINPNLHKNTDYCCLLLLIYRIFNNGVDVIKMSNIPNFMRNAYKSIISMTSKSDMMQKFQSSSNFNSSFVNFMNESVNIQVMTQSEISSFLENYKLLFSKLPTDFLGGNILPSLINKYKFGGLYSEIVEISLLIISRLSNNYEQAQTIIDFLISLYASKDRNIRLLLLNHHDKFLKLFSVKQIEEQIFPCILTGFSDSSPIIKENTIKSIVPTIQYISSKSLKNKLLSHLANSQADANCLIRANTNVCIGKIASYLSPDVLIVAILRGLKDSFALSRRAAIITILNNHSLFTLEQISTKIIPSISLALIDKNADIRLKAIKTLNSLIKRSESFISELKNDVTVEEETNTSETKIGGWFITNFLPQKLIDSTLKSHISKPPIQSLPDPCLISSQISAKTQNDDPDRNILKPSTDPIINNNEDEIYTFQNSPCNEEDLSLKIDKSKPEQPRNTGGWDWDDDW